MILMQHGGGAAAALLRASRGCLSSSLGLYNVYHFFFIISLSFFIFIYHFFLIILYHFKWYHSKYGNAAPVYICKHPGQICSETRCRRPASLASNPSNHSWMQYKVIFFKMNKKKIVSSEGPINVNRPFKILFFLSLVRAGTKKALSSLFATTDC